MAEMSGCGFEHSAGCSARRSYEHTRPRWCDEALIGLTDQDSLGVGKCGRISKETERRRRALYVK
jgi:hypothetical protein